MIKEFDILLGEEIVGTALVEKQGLYFQIRCRCLHCSEELHKILLYSGKNCIDLGTCLRTDGQFEIFTRIPAKGISEEMHFNLVKKGEEKPQFYPLLPGEPFAHITKLRKAKLVIQNGVPGITYQE